MSGTKVGSDETELLEARVERLAEGLEAILKEHDAGNELPRALQMDLFEVAEALLDAIHEPADGPTGLAGPAGQRRHDG